MRRTILKIISLCAFIIVLLCTELTAGPFINIETVDSRRNFPVINLELCFCEIGKSAEGGISEENIRLYEDGFRIHDVKIADLSTSEEPLYIMCLIDSSKSISKDFLSRIKASARKVVSSSADHIGLMRFNDRVILLNGFDGSKADVVSGIDSIKRHGTKTVLYDAVFDALHYLDSVKKGRRAVLLFTDGKDEGSTVRMEDAVSFARELSVPVFCITSKKSKELPQLKRMSKLTGGQCLWEPGKDDIAGMFRSAISNIHNRFRISYRTALKADNKLHRLEVRFFKGQIRDRDIREVKFPASFSFIPESFSYDWIFLFAGILVIFVIVILLLTFNRERKRLSKMINETCSARIVKSHMDRLVDLEDQERIMRAEALCYQDEASIYAEAWLQVKSGREQGKKLPIYWEETTLGSGRENSIVVEDEAVSRKHAKIKIINKTYYLFDLVSDNGTVLNGKKLLRPKALYDWDEIRLGRTEFIFRGARSRV